MLFLWTAPAVAQVVDPAAAVVSGRFVVVDIRETAEFKKQHLRNAVNIPYETIEHYGFNNHEIRDVLSGLGITGRSRLVVCSGWSRKEIPKAGAAAFALYAAGVEDVAILNGGIDRWMALGLPVSTTGSEVKPAAWTSGRQKNISFPPRDLKKALSDKSAVFVDARPIEDFYGFEGQGHLKGARSLPHTFLMEGNLLKKKDEIRKVLNDLDILKKTDIIIYPAGSGAYFEAFILSRLLGGTRVRILTGEMTEWSKKGLLEKNKW